MAGLLLAVSSQPAEAQRRGGGGGTPGEFDFYVLALSWSPNYCETRGDRRGSRQCEPGRNLGFVVHGLWPQYERGFPSECGAERFVPRAALDEAAGVFPEEGLARHQWRRHGTCSGLAPSAFFRAVRTARERITIPEALTALDRTGETTPLAIERAFVDANPGLRTDMMSVQCRQGALQEVRICFSRDLRSFRPCPEVDRRACRFGPIRVSAPR
ncbi:ribonuclease T2 family protein [Enterovirga rhinocerotis]|nr:ribonuclease T2 [Enterovirga rhinocerotis]